MSLDTAPVLVTGATGKQGGAVVRALVAAGIPVRALTRDARRGEEVREDGADLAVGDLDDADSVARAVAGVRGVFSVQMPRMSNSGLDYDGEVRQAESLIKAARAAGVTHFVQSSISGVGQHAKVPGYGRQEWGEATKKFDAKKLIQDSVRTAGFERWTIVKPGTFMENFHPAAHYMFPRGLAGGLVTTLKPETRLSLTAVEDIGATVAAAMTEAEKFHELELELASDYRSMAEVADILSNALETPIAAPDMTEQQATDAGMPAIGASHRWLNTYGQPARPEFARALGIPLTPFVEWSHANLAPARRGSR